MENEENLENDVTEKTEEKVKNEPQKQQKVEKNKKQTKEKKVKTETKAETKVQKKEPVKKDVEQNKANVVKEEAKEPKAEALNPEKIKEPKKEKTTKAPKEPKNKKGKNSTAIVIVILIILGLAGAGTYVLINKDEIFDSDSTSSSTDASGFNGFNGINGNNNSEEDNSTSSSSSSSKLTAKEIYEMLKKDGYSFSVNIYDDSYHVFAFDDKNYGGISIYLDCSLDDSSTKLTFRDSSIDEDGEYTYAYLIGKSGTSSDEQLGLAKKWLKSYKISEEQLQKTLEYVFQNKISLAYHSYFKDDEDNNNSGLSIELSTESITLPYKGTASDASELGNDLIKYVGDDSSKDDLYDELIKVFVKKYKGGTITVKENKEINLNKQGEYPITFTVTSENGNTKKVTANVIVANVSKATIILDTDTVQVTKGTSVDVMSGVSFSSNLPKKDQGKIETSGTVNTNKVGTYTVTYTYVPKEGTNELTAGSKTRTYTVVAEKEVVSEKQPDLSIKEYTNYTLKSDEFVGMLIFENHSFTIGKGYPNAGGWYVSGNYGQIGNNIDFYAIVEGSEDGENSCDYKFIGKVSNGGKTVKVTYENGYVDEFNL